MSDRPRGPSASTPGLLTTGLVGGWLTGSAWASIFIVVAFAASSIRPGVGFDVAMSAGALVLLAAFIWLGGMVCTVIGWFGLAALQRSARVIAWLAILVLVCAVLLPTFGSSLNVAGVRATSVLGIVLVVLFYALQLVFWLRHGTARGFARLAMVGCGLVIASGAATLAVIGIGPGNTDDVIAIVIVFAGPAGGMLAHVGGGLATGRERATVRALRSFD